MSATSHGKKEKMGRNKKWESPEDHSHKKTDKRYRKNARNEKRAAGEDDEV